jgi:hypothetical protein
VIDPIEREPETLLAITGDRVVEPDALDESAVAAVTRIGDDDVEKGRFLRRREPNESLPSQIPG